MKLDELNSLYLNSYAENRDAGNWKECGIMYAEWAGIYEYTLSGSIMEYWTFYGQNEGWIFVRVDLSEEYGTEIFRGANIPWMGYIPEFLKTESGATKYNYCVG